MTKFSPKSLINLAKWLFYLFLFLLPWQTRLILKEGILNGGQWQWGTYSLYATDFIFILLVILFCFNFLIRSSISKSLSRQDPTVAGQISKLSVNKQPLISKTIKRLIIGFVFFVFLSCFWAQDKGLSFYWALRILQGIVLFFIIQKINFSWLKAGLALILAGLVQSFLGIYQFISQKVFASKWLGMAFQDPAQSGVSVVETADGRLLRVYGSLSHPNILAGFLLFLIFVSFVLYLLVKKPWQKYLLLFSAGFITLTFFLTYSRAAWFSLILLVVVFGLLLFIKKNLNYLRKPFIQFFGLIFVILFILVIFSFDYTTTRFEITNRLEARSIGERVLNFQRSAEIIKENFLFGTGLGNYTLALYQKYPNLVSWDYQPVANIYLLVLAEIGIIGLILFLLIFIFTFFRLTVIIYSLPLAGLFILGFFDHWLFSLSCGILLFWLTLGVLWKKC